MPEARSVPLPVSDGDRLRSLPDPLRVLSEFYRAFNEGDFEAMDRVWEHSTAVVGISPFGGVLRGWDVLGGLYRRGLHGPLPVKTEFYDYSLLELGDAVVAVGSERSPPSPDGRAGLSARTTNVVRRLPGGPWKMVHHHVSFGDAKQLAAAEAVFRARSEEPPARPD